eukprot:s693_g4.t1
MPVGASFDAADDNAWDALRTSLWEASIVMFDPEFPAGWGADAPNAGHPRAFDRPGWANGDGADWFTARNGVTELESFLLAVLLGYMHMWDADNDLPDPTSDEDNCLMMFVAGHGVPAQGMIPISGVGAIAG